MAPASSIRTPLRVAVVGRNVSAGLWVRALMAAGGYQVLWLQTEPDPGQRDSEASLLRTGRTPSVPTEQDVPELMIFHRGDRREPLADFLSGTGIWSETRALPECVRRQILACALFSDITPRLWKQGPGGTSVPDPDWIRKVPLSFAQPLAPEGEALPVRRASRQAALEALEREAREAGVQLSALDQTVLGLRVGGRGQKHQITFNAPFGYEEVDAVLWASTLARPKEEATQTHVLRGQPWAESAGRWLGFETFVEASRLVGLPETSLWIVGEAPSAGLLGSGQIARVFRAPGGGLGKVRLQIDRFVLKDEPWTSPVRPDDFLWALLPALGQAPLSYRRLSFDEYEFFRDPKPRLAELAPRVAFWSPGSLGREDEALANWLRPSPPLTARKEVS